MLKFITISRKTGALYWKEVGILGLLFGTFLVIAQIWFFFSCVSYIYIRSGEEGFEVFNQVGTILATLGLFLVAYAIGLVRKFIEVEE